MSSPPLPSAAPRALDRAGIAARIPHAGSMCLLERLLAWDDRQVRCLATGHGDPAHPLRDAVLGLPSATAIEYAAQAMALHGALAGEAAAGTGVPTAPTPGFLASARQVELRVARLDEVAGPIDVQAERLAGDERQALYRFALHDASGRLLVQGRAAVVFASPLPVPLTAAGHR